MNEVVPNWLHREDTTRASGTALPNTIIGVDNAELNALRTTVALLQDENRHLKAENEELHKRNSGWIATSDRLPPPEGHEEYIVALKHFNPEVTGVIITVLEYETRDFFEGEGFIPYWADVPIGNRVTHWMPFPPEPGE